MMKLRRPDSEQTYIFVEHTKADWLKAWKRTDCQEWGDADNPIIEPCGECDVCKEIKR